MKLLSCRFNKISPRFVYQEAPQRDMPQRLSKDTTTPAEKAAQREAQAKAFKEARDSFKESLKAEPKVDTQLKIGKEYTLSSDANVFSDKGIPKAILGRAKGIIGQDSTVKLLDNKVLNFEGDDYVRVKIINTGTIKGGKAFSAIKEGFMLKSSLSDVKRHQEEAVKPPRRPTEAVDQGAENAKNLDSIITRTGKIVEALEKNPNEHKLNSYKTELRGYLQKVQDLKPAVDFVLKTKTLRMLESVIDTITSLQRKTEEEHDHEIAQAKQLLNEDLEIKRKNTERLKEIISEVDKIIAKIKDCNEAEAKNLKLQLKTFLKEAKGLDLSPIDNTVRAETISIIETAINTLDVNKEFARAQKEGQGVARYTKAYRKHEEEWKNIKPRMLPEPLPQKVITPAASIASTDTTSLKPPVPVAAAKPVEAGKITMGQDNLKAQATFAQEPEPTTELEDEEGLKIEKVNAAEVKSFKESLIKSEKKTAQDILNELRKNSIYKNIIVEKNMRITFDKDGAPTLTFIVNEGEFNETKFIFDGTYNEEKGSCNYTFQTHSSNGVTPPLRKDYLINDINTLLRDNTEAFRKKVDTPE